jgi:hypothetical protein
MAPLSNTGEKAVAWLSSIKFCHMGRVLGSEASWAACSGPITGVLSSQPNTSVMPAISISEAAFTRSRAISTVPAHPDRMNEAISNRMWRIVRANCGNIQISAAEWKRL